MKRDRQPSLSEAADAYARASEHLDALVLAKHTFYEAYLQLAQKASAADSDLRRASFNLSEAALREGSV